MSKSADRTKESPKKKSTAGVRTVAFFGGYDAPDNSPAYKFAYDLGYALAEAGFEVLNGGYDGTMTASSRGAKEAGGVTIGITCPADINAIGGPRTPNPYLDEIHPAPTILTRINAMMRLSGAYIVLDGGTGTLCELGIVWEHVSKGFIPPRPIVLAGGGWDGLHDVMHTYRQHSVKHVHRARTIAEIVNVLKEHAVGGTRARNTAQFALGLNDSVATINQLKEIMERFVEERDWQPFHDPKNLSSSIAIEAAELMEHFQWLRSDQLVDIRRDEKKMADIREEIADILAYCLSFATTMDIDLASALATKMVKNAVKYPAPQFRGRFEIREQA